MSFIINKVKKGDKFKFIRTSEFGKEIITYTKIVCIISNRVVFDNGEEIHLNKFKTL